MYDVATLMYVCTVSVPGYHICMYSMYVLCMNMITITHTPAHPHRLPQSHAVQITETPRSVLDLGLVSTSR